MSRRVLGSVALLVVVGLFAMPEAAQFLFFSTKEFGTSALLSVTNQPNPRFQVSYIGDLLNPKVCVMHVFDVETGFRTQSTVDPESCYLRGARRPQ
jgi:hypothetical protein